MVSDASSKPVRRAAKSTRLVARISPQDKAVIARAAALTGASVADFVVSQARVAATRLVEEHNLIRLNVEESRRLMDALLAPPRPATASMKRALKQYKKSVLSDLDSVPPTLVKK
jgi:uncharacterized protein (DUF1778 family)